MRSVMKPAWYPLVEAALATNPGTGCMCSITHV